MAAGRNDPCPCGSGKKYKRCCLASSDAPADATWYRLRRIIDELDAKLAAHGRELRGRYALLRAWDEFTLWEDEPFDPEGPHLSAFLPWFFFDWAPDPEDDEESDDGIATEVDDDRTIAQSYLDRHGRRLEPLEREYLERAGEARFSFFEVLDVDRGRSVHLRDVLVGGETEVTEHSGSLTCQRGDIFYAKVAEIAGTAILVGCGSTLIPPTHKGSIIELRARMRGPREAVDGDDLIFWEAEIRELYLAIHATLHAPPRLANTDGEPLSLHTLTWDIESPETAFAALRPLAGGRDDAELLADAERDEAGRLRKVSFDWLKSGNAMHAGLETTILGRITIDGTRLAIEVNSKERADRVRAEVDTRLADGAVHRSTVAQSPHALLRERRGGSTAVGEREGADPGGREHAALLALPEVRAKIREMTIAHWTAWVDQPIPALGGRTPRQAAGTADGREALEGLLLDFERHADPDDPSRDPGDIVRLRERLGLRATTA